MALGISNSSCANSSLLPTPRVAPTSSATMTTRAAKPRFTFHAVSTAGIIPGRISLEKSCFLVGRMARSMSRYSLEMLLMPSWMISAKFGRQPASRMKAMRVSTWLNQMMAKTTQESAGIPMMKCSTGRVCFSTVWVKPMNTPRMVPLMKARTSPRKIRPMVINTSPNRPMLTTISMKAATMTPTLGIR